MALVIEAAVVAVGLGVTAMPVVRQMRFRADCSRRLRQAAIR